MNKGLNLEPGATSFMTSFGDGSCSLIIKIQSANLLDLLSGFPLKLLHANMQLVPQAEEDSCFNMTSHAHADFELGWNLKCLGDSQPLTNFENFASKVIESQAAGGLDSKVLPALELVQSEASLLTDLAERFEYTMKNPKFIPNGAARSKKNQRLKRLMITPTRIIALPDVEMSNSRLRKKIPDLHMIIVCFRDESLSALNDVDSIETLSEFLKTGFRFGDKQFHYLCSSASQLRDHNGIFVQADTVKDVQEIRRSIADPKAFDITAKYMSRIGLFSTPGDFVGKVCLKTQVHYSEDTRAKNQSLLTDGCGKIKESFANSFEEDLTRTCSAIQFRLAGAKGVLTIVSDDDKEFQALPQKVGIILRQKSMVKFDSNDEDLLIVSRSMYQPVTLNREAINLLDSLARLSEGQIDDDLIRMEHNALRQLTNRLESQAVAQGALSGYIDGNIISAVGERFALTLEPYWFSLLVHSYHLEALRIQEKANIPVEKGCRLMGISDPFGTLRDGEVFLKIEDDRSTYQGTLEERVLIYRNPCLHPGDLRVVKAVSNKCLEKSNLKNVLVFPSRSDCLTSLAEECSGGDLDGDEFSVIWDERLIPQSLFSPLDYAGIAAKGTASHTLERHRLDVNSPEAVADFFRLNMMNDSLGRVANMHLALCDMMEKGACDDLACKLAESQSVAVDFPKTGILPDVPKKARDEVQAKGYPDFMREDGYQSIKILGSLYRRAKSYTFGSQVRMDNSPEVDYTLLRKGRQAYVKDAKLLYDQYCNDLNILMQKFGLKEEADMVLGQPLLWHPFFRSNKGKASKALQMSWRNLQEKYLTLFQLGVQTKEESLKKASAWYQVSYKRKQRRFLSFAWIVCHHLCEIKEQANLSCPSVITLDKGIGQKAIQYQEKKIKVQEQRIQLCHATFRNLQKVLPNQSISVYGSGSIFLDGELSDLDLSCSPTNSPAGIGRKSANYILNRDILPEIEKHAESSSSATGRKNPVIRCQLRAGFELVHCDISIDNREGLAKTAYFQALYKKKPSTLVAFRSIVYWARCCGILKAFQKDTSLLCTAEFYAFVLKTVESELPKIELGDSSSTEVAVPVDLWDELIDQISQKKSNAHFAMAVGSLILTFFRNVAALSENQDLEYVWPLVEVQEAIVIPTKVVKIIQTYCAKSFHVLLATKDFEQVLDHIYEDSREIDISKKLSPHLCERLMVSKDYFTEKFLRLSGVKALTLDNIPGECNGLLLHARGNRSSLVKLNAELISMSGSKIFKSRIRTDRYFMENASSLYLYRGCQNDRLRFVKYEGGHQQPHAHMELCQVERLNGCLIQDADQFWHENQIALARKMREQLLLLNGTAKSDVQQSLELTTR